MDLMKCFSENDICNKTEIDVDQEGKLKNILDLYPVLHSFFTNGTVYETLEIIPDDGTPKNGRYVRLVVKFKLDRR